jgi:hypothetical protein
MIHKGYVILAAYQCGSGFWYTHGLASEIETVEIVSLGLEDHGLRSHAAI